METREQVPIVLYDNQCDLCIKFAKIVGMLAKKKNKKILLVGHYTPFGKNIRERLLDASATSMFWFINTKTAYGGRAALIPLIRTILARSKIKQIECAKDASNYDSNTARELYDCKNNGDVECNTAKAVFIRSASLFRNSKKIQINL